MTEYTYDSIELVSDHQKAAIELLSEGTYDELIRSRLAILDFIAAKDAEIAELNATNQTLLKALEWFVENDDTNICEDGNEFWVDGLNAGIAAIAKATK
jgi:hypothetical protein